LGLQRLLVGRVEKDFRNHREGYYRPAEILAGDKSAKQYQKVE